MIAAGGEVDLCIVNITNWTQTAMGRGFSDKFSIKVKLCVTVIADSHFPAASHVGYTNSVAISIAINQRSWIQKAMIIGIDHDTVCAGVGGTAIRHSTSCAGRRAAACGRAGRHNECCAWWQYHPRQRGPYKWSISILPRSQFYKKQGKLAFSTSCTAVRPHRRLRNDAWRRDS